MNAKEFQSRVEAIEKIYAQIPKVHCQQRCGAEYCGPIPLTAVEWRRIKERFPEIEALESDTGFILNDGCLTCPLLDAAGLCSAYDLRPVICRLFGAVSRLKCHYGCVAERTLTEIEELAILRGIMTLGSE